MRLISNNLGSELFNLHTVCFRILLELTESILFQSWVLKKKKFTGSFGHKVVVEINLEIPF